MSRIVQLVAAAVPHDAIWRVACRLRDAAGGIIVAPSIDPAVADDAVSLADVALDAGDTLVYHASTATPVADWMCDDPGAARCRAVMLFHNVTPPAFFDPWAPHIAAELRAARRQIAGLAGRVEQAVAASRFSADDLTQLGFADVAVAALPLDPSWYPSAARPTAARDDRRQGGGAAHGAAVRLLTVGRISPNKAIEHQIRALAVDRDAQLDVIGGVHIPAYAWALHRYAAHLGVADRVRFWGKVAQNRLDAAFAAADCVVSTSEHEGFGVPVLEAMAYGTPVVALDRGAIAEVAGGAALLLPDPDPRLLAAAWRDLADDAALSGQMRGAGRHRFTEAVAPARTNEMLAALGLA